MTNHFDPEQGLARWTALDEEKWSRFYACKAYLAQQDIPGREKLHLIKTWMAEINESQRAELTLLLRQFRAAGFSLQLSKPAGKRIWNLVPLPPEVEAPWRERDEEPPEEA